MITVLTPTYNRSHTLPRLYESLCNQESKNFEWVVVDDGSTDNTQALLFDLAKSASFTIQIISQPNSGKHVAVNTGVSVATGDWIFIVDSDDALTPDAIGTIEVALNNFSSDNLVGLCFRRAYFDGRIIGNKIEGPSAIKLTPTKAGALFQGDLAYVFKRDSMLKHPFPVIRGEKFVPELYIWNKISDEGDIYFFGDKYIYFCEYLPDGYSHNFSKNLRRNPQGFMLFYRSQISREDKIIRKIKCTIRMVQCYLYILWGAKK